MFFILFHQSVNPLNAELNPICHLIALLGGATIVDVSRLRVKVYRCLLMDAALKIHALLVSTTYHFLGRKQIARTVNYSKLPIQKPPFILTVHNWLTIKLHTPCSTHSAVKFKYFNSIGYLTYRCPVSFLVFSSPYWSPPLSITLLSLSLQNFPTLYPSNCYTDRYTRLSTN
jgi:hypothetical protein